MTAAYRTLTLTVAAVLSFVAVQGARADHGHALTRIENASRGIQSESRELYYELRGVAFSNPELRSALSEVGQVYQLATRIHNGVHGYGNVSGMDRNVHSLKRLVHHVEEHLAGYGHFRRHIDRIDRLTHDLEDAVHDLADGDFGSGSVYREPAYSGPVYSGPVIGTRPSSGITIGGRGFSFSIGR
jgi:uncharacterized protein (UPF0335 family)